MLILKIPKVIKENGREYQFIKKCNDTIYLYEETKYGYKKCFSKFDLGIRTKQLERTREVKPENDRYF